MADERQYRVPRREFVRTAVAIGGTTALSACLDRERAARDATAGSATDSTPEFPQGTTEFDSLPERQHAWAEYVRHDRFGNTVVPQHQVLLFLDYHGSTPPSPDRRETVETALRTLERAFQRGVDRTTDDVMNDGLLFMLGYSRAYFDRFDADLPASLDLPAAETVLDDLDENRSKATAHDALLLLTSDYGSIPLAAEAALFGDRDRLNGVPVEARLDDTFEIVERRTGFVGRGLPAERLDNEEIPEQSPLSMGFKSGYTDNLPPEDKVTITDGPFAEGTTAMVSRLAVALEEWYDRSEEERVHQMFSPEHTPEQVGEGGVRLAGDSGVTEETVERIDEDARSHGCLGHSQKLARARDEEFDPRILRRSESVATDTADVGFNFVSVQRGMADFVATRRAMDGHEFDGEIDDANHGILPFLDLRSRASILLPPRGRRALPEPRPDSGTD